MQVQFTDHFCFPPFIFLDLYAVRISLIILVAAAMTQIMKTQVELALQNRNVPLQSQPQTPVPAVVVERSKAEKLQDAMEIESRRRTQQFHDDRKRKFNSLDADAKEVTGERLRVFFQRIVLSGFRISSS